MTERLWSGNVVREARSYWAARLPLACSRCTLDVLAEQRWHVDHLVPRAEGGDPLARSNQWPAHARCNEQAGQALAARLNRRRRGGLATLATRRSWL